MVSKWSSSANGGGPGSLRKVHRALVLRELHLRPGTSRIELAGRLGLSSMAVGRIVRELHDAGLSGETQPGQASGRGRPATGLSLRARGAYVLGAVISAYSQEIHLLDLRGESVASRRVRVDDVSRGVASVELFCEQARQLIADAGVARRRVAGAGFAVAANVDNEHGTVIGGGYLGWAPFDLAATARDRLRLPVTVANIADTLLRAEAFAGCARGAKGAVLIHSATTLGASYSFHGQLISGARFQSGRIGHFPHRPTRLVCSCGQSDCLNCSASGWSVLSRLGVLDSPAYRVRAVRRYSRLTRALVDGTLQLPAGSRNATRLLRAAGTALARGLRFVELTFDPDVLVLAGPMASHDAYFDGVTRGLRESGPGGSEIAATLTRGGMTPGRAAGMVALLDTVLSPNLELRRLSASAAGGTGTGSRR